MNTQFSIIWPRYAILSADEMRGRYSDAVANNEVENAGLTEVEEMAHELESCGLITLGAVSEHDLQAQAFEDEADADMMARLDDGVYDQERSECGS